MVLQQTELKSMKIWQPSRLPAEYQEVEYIQSSGTQYIDTGYLPSSTPKIDIDLEFINGDSYTWAPLYGRRGATNTTYFCLYVNSSSLYITPNYAGFDPGTSSGVTISKNTKYNIVNNAGQLYLDGVLKTSASTTNTLANSTYPIFLFDNNVSGARQGRNTQMKLYSCKMYNDNTLVRDFVPCYRKQDGEIGLYDLVNDIFYTNAGTGTFTKGNDTDTPAEKEIKRVTIRPNGVEKQIRPVQQSLTFSYDFRNKSVATLTNDGWERPDGSSGVSFGVNGMYKSSSGYKRAIYPISFAGAKTITLTGTCAAVSDKDIAMGLEYYNGSSWNTATIMWSTGADNVKLRLWDTSGTLINTFLNTSTLSNGEHTVTLTIDTTAKTVSFSDGSNSGTYSLTDSEISVILASQGIRAAVAKSGNYFHDISVTITY